jgi:hypothetical protein
VDDDVMVEPAECREVDGVGVTAFREGDDVVHFESMSGRAPVGGAAAVSMEDGPAERRGDCSRAPPYCQRGGASGEDGFDAAVAEEFFEGAWSDALSGVQGDAGDGSG